MTVCDALIGALADGETHSGSALAARLGVSRSAIWKQVRRLPELGVEVDASAGRGYRLRRPIELLERDAILAALDAGARAACDDLGVISVAESTNAILLAAPRPPPGHWRALLAEFQTAGRGRRGRRWFSPYASGLCLSYGWTFATSPRDLPALSLAAGVAVRRALAATGADPSVLKLKWPNDLLLGDAKLGGILVDVDGDTQGPLRAIIGVGLNLTVPRFLLEALDASGGLLPGGLDAALGGRTPQRNRLAAGILGSLYAVVGQFARTGLGPLADEWRQHDALYGRPVTVRAGTETVSGTACGISADGALLLEGPAGLASVFAGDVTLRAGA